MSNKQLTDKNSKEIAHELFYSWIEELHLKLARIEDVKILDDLKDMAFQKNREDIIKLVDARASELRGS